MFVRLLICCLLVATIRQITRQEKFRAILSASRLLRAAARRRSAAVSLLRTCLWIGDASRAGARTQTVAASQATNGGETAGRAHRAAERGACGGDERRGVRRDICGSNFPR